MYKLSTLNTGIYKHVCTSNEHESKCMNYNFNYLKPKNGGKCDKQQSNIHLGKDKTGLLSTFVRI